VAGEEEVLPAPALLTKRAVATYLGVSERTVDRLVAGGQLRAYRIGGHLRFRPADVEFGGPEVLRARAPPSLAIQLAKEACARARGSGPVGRC
jgi:excisionase family DNA binding protein